MSMAVLSMGRLVVSDHAGHSRHRGVLVLVAGHGRNGGRRILMVIHNLEWEGGIDEPGNPLNTLVFKSGMRENRRLRN